MMGDGEVVVTGTTLGEPQRGERKLKERVPYFLLSWGFSSCLKNLLYYKGIQVT